MSVLIKKKILFKNTSGFFILLLVVYVYFIGAIAAYGLKRENHRALLKTELLRSIKTENAFMAASSEKNLEYLTALGYETPKDLDIIKRTSNVAASDAAQNIFY